MTVPAGKHRFSYSYTSDNGFNYNVTLEVDVAAAAGASAGGADLPSWGNHAGRNKLRGIHGITADGTQKAFLPCMTQANMESIFNSGGFSIGSTNYVVTGRRGERFTAGRLPGS